MTAPETTEADLWERPIMRHIHDFARARRAAPLATLVVTLGRVIAHTPAGYVHETGIGTYASLNFLTAIVARSGGGKGLAMQASEAAVRIVGLDPISGKDVAHAPLGSGEGMAHLFSRYVPPKRGEEGHIKRLRECVLIDVPEVDILTALDSRQGSTTTAKMRMAFSGEALGFSYADPTKAVGADYMSYRVALLLSVQPKNAGALLAGEGGGTPQRFLWVPGQDPHMPRRKPADPAAGQRSIKALPQPMPLTPLGLCQQAKDELDDGVYERNFSDGDELDAHAGLTRLKAATGLALLEERDKVTEDDWRLAGVLMQVSDRTRAETQAAVRQVHDARNQARGRDEGVRAVLTEDAKHTALVQRASRSIKNALKGGEWMAGAKLRQLVPGRHKKPEYEEALASLLNTREIESRPTEGQTGVQYRSTQ